MNDKTATPDAADTVKTLKVTLLEPHTHRGIDLLPGAQITLREDQAKRLIAAGRAK